VPHFRGRLPDETDQAYLTRLVHLISQFDDNQWNALPEPAQGWFNAQVNDSGAMNETIKLPEGYPEQPKPAVRRRVVKPAEPKTEAEAAPTPEPAQEAAPEPASNGHDTSEPLPDSITKHLDDIASGEAPVRRKRTRKAAEPKERKPRAGRKPQPNSVITAIREEVTRNPQIRVEELRKVLADREFTVKESTVHQTKAAHIASLRVAQALGWTSGEMPGV
jgi:hypothetical protein